MEAKEFYIYAKWCNDNHIFFYVVATTSLDIYKIGMRKNGREKIGNEIYRPIKGEEHPVYEKIRELYKQIYFTNQQKAA